jgi:hypothetical protein
VPAGKGDVEGDLYMTASYTNERNKINYFLKSYGQSDGR